MIRFYDVRIEAIREATQADWDLLWDRAWANADRGKAMDDLNHVVLRMLDELRTAQQRSNSPTDHLAAIEGHLSKLMANYDEIHAAVHEPPAPAMGRYHVGEYLPMGPDPA